MKYLIVTIVVVVAVWLLVRSRKPGRPAADASRASNVPQAMVQCSHCGLHLPRAEALVTDQGSFCGEEHRLAGPRDV